MADKKSRDVALSLAPSNGIRSLCCLGIVVAHCLYWASLAMEDKAALYKGYAANIWMDFILHNAEPSMEAFLVLTGFLAAISLIPALESSTNLRRTIYRYYQKRVLRIVPAYYGVLTFFHAFVLPHSGLPHVSQETRRAFFDHKQPFDAAVCRKLGWMNFLFANNMLANAGCMNTTWSLAVQMQFYAVLPLALLLLRPRTPGFRNRIWRTAAAVFAFVLVYRAVIFLASRLWHHMPLPFFGPLNPRNEALIDFLGLYLYTSFVARLGPLSLGMLAALAATDIGSWHFIARHKGKLLATLAVLLLAVTLGSAEPKIGPAPDPSHKLADPVMLGFAFNVMIGVAMPGVTALAIVLTTTGQSGLPKRLAAALSSQPLIQLADISYDIYLIHPLVIYGVWTVLPPSTWFSFDNPMSFALIATLVLALSIPAAWVQHKAWAIVTGNVERKLGIIQASKVNMHVRAGKVE